MSGVEVVALLVAIGLFFYLALALLKPEWFA
jgi:K+-transporting ATPase KdpF subunit